MSVVEFAISRREGEKGEINRISTPKTSILSMSARNAIRECRLQVQTLPLCYVWRNARYSELYDWVVQFSLPLTSKLKLHPLIFRNGSSAVSSARPRYIPDLNKEYSSSSQKRMPRACDCLERDMYALQWKKTARFLRRTQAADAFARDSAARSPANKLRAFYPRLHANGTHKDRPGDRRAAASNSVAKTGCAARRIASLRVHETHIWTVLTHFVAACIHRARLFKRDRGGTWRAIYTRRCSLKIHWRGAELASRYCDSRN